MRRAGPGQAEHMRAEEHGRGGSIWVLDSESRSWRYYGVKLPDAEGKRKGRARDCPGPDRASAGVPEPSDGHLPPGIARNRARVAAVRPAGRPDPQSDDRMQA
jgi:hypothetical protein